LRAATRVAGNCRTPSIPDASVHPR